MKKLIFLIISLLMIPIVAFALENKTINVSVGSVEEDNTISVDFSWGNLEFTYVVENNYNWNSNTHKYEKSVKSYWTNNGNNIIVNNNSNREIIVSAKYDNYIDSLKGSFSESNVVINAKRQKEINFSISGVLSSSYSKGANAGLITFEIK